MQRFKYEELSVLKTMSDIFKGEKSDNWTRTMSFPLWKLFQFAIHRRQAPKEHRVTVNLSAEKSGV